MMHIERVGDVRCGLGEGPVWDVAAQALYFTDVLARKIRRPALIADPESDKPVMGFHGKLVLVPAQVRNGPGVVDGQFIDPVVIAPARATIARADAPL